MARLNPVRGQYLLQGLDFVRAGILKGVFIREDNKAPLPSDVPSLERWVSGRAVMAAAARAGVPLDMSAIPASIILPFLQQDPKFKVWTTEERIVALLGGDNPKNRAYAQAEVAQLEANYASVPAAAAA